MAPAEVLAENNRLGELDKISDTFDDIMAAVRGEVKATITTAEVRPQTAPLPARSPSEDTLYPVACAVAFRGHPIPYTLCGRLPGVRFQSVVPACIRLALSTERRGGVTHGRCGAMLPYLPCRICHIVALAVPRGVRRAGLWRPAGT